VEPQSMNPLSLTTEQAARILSTTGKRLVNPEAIEADIAAGAPTNADKTINLIHYAAWLVQESPRAN
jgi:hypothetical protein